MNLSHTELLSITRDRNLFEKISAAKNLIVSVFSEVGNQLATVNLKEVHATEKGIKISKGNELRQCPYQVLDIVRDFDMNKGLNIRILHWWGRGMFLFLFFGKNHPALENLLPKKSHVHEFSVCMTDRWDYGEIIDNGKTQHFSSIKIKEHLRIFSHLQLVKPICIAKNEAISETLISEITESLTLIGSIEDK
ncbi:hypothetical protein [Cyclobacterium jeungdonense]|uniref:Uncharacterized protein n=1 Tax=Cyclobacterium jeungdonense TaxID=708087 RepID=A0ABT8C2I7_9BACT|nr:hypothetical protein [Cyclobacterium jeungdonense]MDN3686567.1 hypothetical protein [Cyclobacterium jeungdonense]